MIHPITHTDQHYVVPAACEDGDYVGQVHFLWTHKEWFNLIFFPYLAPITWESYAFEIVGGNADSTFSISPTGMLSIADHTGFTESRAVTVRISIPVVGMHMDTTCHIERVLSANCVFFDSEYTGTSDGSHESPYKKWSSGNGGANLNPGEAGKTYFWKRGRVWGNLSTNREFTKVVNGENDDDITFATYGIGDRPKMLIGNNLESEVWLDMGMQPQDPQKDVTNVLYNFRIFDIHIDAEHTNRLPVRGRQLGKNWRFYRVKAEKSNFSNGNFWFIGTLQFGNIQKDLRMYDCESSDHNMRGIKFECGGVESYNWKLTKGRGAPISATNWPNVLCKYVWSDYEGSELGLGCNIRAKGHRYEFMYLRNYGHALTCFVHIAVDGLGLDLDESCWFKNIILDGCRNTPNNFTRHDGVTDTCDGVIYENILHINSNFGFLAYNQAENINFRNIIAVRKDPGAGTGFNHALSSGAKPMLLRNSLFLNYATSVTVASGKETKLVNTIYDGSLGGAGQITQTTNSQNTSDFEDRLNGDFRLLAASALIAAGTHYEGHDFDIAGNAIDPAAVSIGPYQHVTDPDPEPDPTYSLTVLISPVAFGTVQVSPPGPYREDDQVTLEASAEEEKIFIGFDVPGEGLVQENPYVFDFPGDDLEIVAVFADEVPTEPIFYRGKKFVLAAP